MSCASCEGWREGREGLGDCEKLTCWSRSGGAGDKSLLASRKEDKARIAEREGNCSQVSEVIMERVELKLFATIDAIEAHSLCVCVRVRLSLSLSLAKWKKNWFVKPGQGEE